MVSFIYLFYAWLIAVALFSLLAAFTSIIALRFGLSSFGTYMTTAVFLAVSVLVIVLVGGFSMTVDWSQTVNLIPSSAPTLGL
jgi:hypothetical protein